jgi:hypothetical protein
MVLHDLGSRRSRLRLRLVIPRKSLHERDERSFLAESLLNFRTRMTRSENIPQLNDLLGDIKGKRNLEDIGHRGRKQQVYL